MKYVVLYARTANGYSAHVPDLPGCIAAAATLDETRRLMKEAIEFHLEGMRLHGEHIPAPATTGEEVEIPVPS
jgi:predicted RNase H-like HicB family nuclease